MNRTPDRKRLLTEVLAEGAPDSLRSALLETTLRHVGRRRRLRQAGHITSILAVMALLALWIRRDLPRQAPLPAAPVTVTVPVENYFAVHTQPLPTGAVIHTRPLGADQIVTSAPNTSFVSTATERRSYRIINDAELLAIAGPKPAALVRVGPNLEKLIFMNPEDQTTIH